MEKTLTRTKGKREKTKTESKHGIGKTPTGNYVKKKKKPTRTKYM
jgi:hypothetical protein